MMAAAIADVMSLGLRARHLVPIDFHRDPWVGAGRASLQDVVVDEQIAAVPADHDLRAALLAVAVSGLVDDAIITRLPENRLLFDRVPVVGVGQAEGGAEKQV